jgi:Tfp pilus assembly protein FimV
MSAQHTIDPSAADLLRWTPVLVPPLPTEGLSGEEFAAEDRSRFATLTSTPTADEVAALRPPTRAAAWRRRLGAVAVLVLLAFLLTAGIGRVTAGAQLADPVAGTVTIGPGETLWDVAAATAPPGVGVAEQLAAINDLNGFDSASIDPWTVVLVPAR